MNKADKILVKMYEYILINGGMVSINKSELDSTTYNILEKLVSKYTSGGATYTYENGIRECNITAFNFSFDGIEYVENLKKNIFFKFWNLYWKWIVGTLISTVLTMCGWYISEK
jgi:hypothetical protein